MKSVDPDLNPGGKKIGDPSIRNAGLNVLIFVYSKFCMVRYLGNEPVPVPYCIRLNLAGPFYRNFRKSAFIPT